MSSIIDKVDAALQKRVQRMTGEFEVSEKEEKEGKQTKESALR